MSLEGLLTYFGLLVAALTIMSPVQRRSLGLFIPKLFLPISIIIALILLVVRDMPLDLPTAFGGRLDLVTYLLTLGAFLIPVIAALFGWWRWYTAKLTNRRVRWSRGLTRLGSRANSSCRSDVLRLKN